MDGRLVIDDQNTLTVRGLLSLRIPQCVQIEHERLRGDTRVSAREANF
jgi:hypothetical protein